MWSVGNFLLIINRSTKRRLMIHIMWSVGNFLLIIDRSTKRRLVVKRDPYHVVSRKFFINY
jgi:hypothetical protein